jgi:hypothetical protein
MKESKQDVFEAVMCDYDEVLGCAVDHGYYGDALTAGEYRARYAAAGKVAVPREVGKYIDWCKAHDMSLQEAIYPDAYHTTEEIDKLLTDWIAEKSDQFAEAWNHRWVAKEDEK